MWSGSRQGAATVCREHGSQPVVYTTEGEFLTNSDYQLLKKYSVTQISLLNRLIRSMKQLLYLESLYFSIQRGSEIYHGLARLDGKIVQVCLRVWLSQRTLL